MTPQTPNAPQYPPAPQHPQAPQIPQDPQDRKTPQAPKRPARRRLPLVPAALAATALLASCSQSSGDDDSPGPSPSRPSSSASSPGTGRPASPGPSATPSPSGSPTPSPTPTPSGPRWKPKPGLAWQWQLTGTLDVTVDAPVYDIDGFNHPASTVADLHRRGRKVICYVSVGAWEDFRPDAGRFPKQVLGRGNGWEGERWLDIRRLDVLKPLMAKRFDMCRDKGFDAVEPDNVDGYLNETGFPLTAEHQLAFNRMIAALAHERGLAVGLKNDLEQIPQLVGDFDFAVNEQCAQYEECDTLTPFIEAQKAVFHVEYELPAARFCDQARDLKLSSLQKRLHLDAWRRSC